MIRIVPFLLTSKVKIWTALNKENPLKPMASEEIWSRRQDLNLRPLRPERSALPN